jgi:hypothetical protein
MDESVKYFRMWIKAKQFTAEIFLKMCPRL